MNIDAIQEQAFPVAKDLRAVLRKGKWGLMDFNLNIRAPFEYDAISRFNEGRSAARRGDAWGYLNEAGEEVIPFLYDGAYPFCPEGVAWVEKDHKYALIDLEGRAITPFQYDCSGTFYKGLTVASRDERYGIINFRGEVVLPLTYYYCEPFQEGLACVQEVAPDAELPYPEDVKYGFVNTQGEVVVPCIYERAFAFFGGEAEVKKEGKWGLINPQGETIVPFIYNNCYEIPGHEQVDI